MSELTLELTFYGSVRMGTGYAGKGLDEVIDEFAPLSAGGLKGVLRDEARTLLPPRYDADGRFERDHPFVRAVFGDRFGQQCPWNFDVVPDAGKVSARASLQIGPDGAVVKGALLVKEEAWIGSARLDVFQRGPLSDAGMRLGASDPDPRVVGFWGCGGCRGGRVGARSCGGRAGWSPVAAWGGGSGLGGSFGWWAGGGGSVSAAGIG
mgnify:CR=1 FL=1